MIDRALKQIKKNEKIIKNKYNEATKRRQYRGWDIGDLKEKTISHNGIIYIISPAFHSVVDDYDENLGSIELSHRESSGYSLISGYKVKKNNLIQDCLDFTFAKTEDIIELKVDENIENIKLNSINLRYSTIESTKKLNFNIVFDNNVFDNALSFRMFIENNRDIIKSINFEGLSDNKILRGFVKRICAKNEIFEITFEESTNSSEKTFVK